MSIVSPLFKPARIFALPLAFLLVAAPPAQSAPLPLTTIDFSGGTDDWNPQQTSGKFRRTDSGVTTQVRIETNGSDAYLRTGGAPTLFYDDNPSTPEFTLLSVGAGESLHLSVDFSYFNETVTGGLVFGIYSPDATGPNKGFGAAVRFNEDPKTSPPSYLTSWSAFTNTTGGIGSLSLTGFTGVGAIDQGLSASTLYRLELIYTNQETQGAFVFNLYSLAGSEPTLIKSSTGTLAYGTGTNDLDLDPNSLALEFRFNNLNNLGSAISEVRFEVIPEPSVAGLIGAAALGLAALKAKGKNMQ